MKRAISVLTCVAILLFATSSTVWAAGPRVRSMHLPHHMQMRGPNFQHWNPGYRVPAYPYGFSQRPIGVYPVYRGPVYNPGVYGPQFGFGVGGPNFSMWYAQ